MVKSKLPLIITVVAAVLLGGLGVGLWLYIGRDVDTEMTAQTQDDGLQIASAKMALESRFPEAQLTFGQAFVHWSGDLPAVCGRVDIVEEQDSFDGEERYVFSDGALTIEEVDGTEALEQKWSDVCQ